MSAMEKLLPQFSISSTPQFFISSPHCNCTAIIFGLGLEGLVVVIVVVLQLHSYHVSLSVESDCQVLIMFSHDKKSIGCGRNSTNVWF
jgi:hypothetical protein